MKKINDEKKNEMLKLYNLGMKMSDIGEKVLGIKLKDSQVRYIMEKNNINFNRRNRTKRFNMIGQSFGYLLVNNIVRNEKSTRDHPWRAICTCTKCGKTNVDIDSHSLINGRTKSCGCDTDFYAKLTGVNHKSYTGYEKISGTYWSKVRDRAISQNREFTISIEYAWNLYLKQRKKCALSGMDIEFGTSSINRRRNTASLDRIDSNKGYVEGNVQWVHKDVNIMKNAFEQSYYIEVCKKIAITFN